MVTIGKPILVMCRLSVLEYHILLWQRKFRINRTFSDLWINIENPVFYWHIIFFILLVIISQSGVISNPLVVLSISIFKIVDQAPGVFCYEQISDVEVFRILKSFLRNQPVKICAASRNFSLILLLHFKLVHKNNLDAGCLFDVQLIEDGLKQMHIVYHVCLGLDKNANLFLNLIIVLYLNLLFNPVY